MTWPTSWTQCWTEPCSLLPFPASGCSASARGAGGERIWRCSVPPGLSSRLPPCTLHRGRERGRPSSPAPRHRPQNPPAPCHTPRPSRGGQAFPTGLAAGGEPQGAAPVVPEAAEEPSHSAEEPSTRDRFLSTLHCRVLPLIIYPLPTMCQRKDLPGQPPRSWLFTEQIPAPAGPDSS